MSARNITTNQLVSGYVSNGWYNGRKSTTVRQRIIPTHGQTIANLSYQLPPRARIVWAEVLTQTGLLLSTTGDGTNTANSVALMMYPTTGTVALTSPPTTGTQSSPAGTNGYMVIQTPGTATDSNGQARGVPLIFGTVATNQCVNTNTVSALLAIQPSLVSSNRVSFTTTGTANFRFGTDTSTTTNTNTCGAIDVTLYVEEYDQAPYA